LKLGDLSCPFKILIGAFKVKQFLKLAIENI
jgi:hypothetical protein